MKKGWSGNANRPVKPVGALLGLLTLAREFYARSPN
jgi:hypothetical protein